MRHRKVRSPLCSYRQSTVLLSSPSLTFTRAILLGNVQRPNLTREGNEEIYEKLLSLSMANICRINELAVYNLFSTLAKPVLFHLSWETTEAWIIHEGSACLSCSLAHKGWVYTLKCKDVKLRPSKHCYILVAGVSCVCPCSGVISMSLGE